LLEDFQEMYYFRTEIFSKAIFSDQKREHDDKIVYPTEALRNKKGEDHSNIKSTDSDDQSQFSRIQDIFVGLRIRRDKRKLGAPVDKDNSHRLSFLNFISAVWDKDFPKTETEEVNLSFISCFICN
jgi:hypothetical protein